MVHFYPITNAPGDLDNVRVVPTYEAIPWMRDKTTKGLRKATFTKWISNQDIKLIAIFQNSSYYDKSSFTKRLLAKYNEFLNHNSVHREKTIVFNSYLASEFAKDVTEHDYDYMISALFTETVIDNGFDGILYPSVRLGGAGFNIALTPQAVDNKLNLYGVMECVIYKYFDKTVMDNEYQAILYPNQTHFIFEKVYKDFRAGEKTCLKALGLSSIDELK